MTHLLLATGMIAAAMAAQDASVFRSDVATVQKPWTHLGFQNHPDDFQFAIIADNTGGWRAGVFENAVGKLNQLMPEFVINVGDCIKGTTRNTQTNAREWEEFTAMTQRLKMPFFIVAGNHDIQMKWLPNRVQPEEMLEQWRARFGPTYYSFVYKNVLFVVLFSNDGLARRVEQHLSEEQVAYFEETIRAHPGVRRTFVLLHHPLWAYPHQSNFARIEAALAGRKYTVIAGHQHRYMHFERNQTNYYILATTGGSSPLRGTAFGEFDHVTWVTMKDDGPVLTNLRLDGILPHDVFTPALLAPIRALEDSSKIETGVLLDGEDPVRGGSLFLMLRNASDRPLRVEGEFRHHPRVHPRPGRIARVLPPRTQEAVEVALTVMEPFAAADEERLEFTGEFRFADEPTESGLRLPAKVTVLLAPAPPAVWITERRTFVDSVTIAPRFDRDEREVRFTWDGTEPTRESPRFDRPHTMTDSTTLKARLFARGGAAGPVDELHLEKIPSGQGLLCHYYEHDTSEGNVNVMPIFAGLPPTCTLRVSNFDLDQIVRRPENFATVFYGWLEVEESGNHDFHVTSADGARLFIDGDLVVNDPIKHPRQESSGSVRLDRGRHAIEVHFFQANRDCSLDVEFTPPSGGRRSIPDALLSFDAQSAPTLITPSVSHVLE